MNTFKAVGFTLAALMAGYLGAFLERVAKGDSGVLDELNVRRLNIVEDNGNYALVIANSNNLPASNVNGGGNGAVRSGIPGMIFYNNLGDEIGGIIYPARDLESGYDGGVQLSMDQIKQTGQAIALRHWRNGHYVRSALEIVDYSTTRFAGDADSDPEVQAVLARFEGASDEEQERLYLEEYLPMLGEKGYFAHRVFLGSEGENLNRTSKLELRDSRSRTRIRLVVDENDEARIEILDSDGNVIENVAGS